MKPTPSLQHMIARIVLIALAWAIGAELLSHGWEQSYKYIGLTSPWWLLLDYALVSAMGVLAGYLPDWDHWMRKHPNDFHMGKIAISSGRLWMFARDAFWNILGGCLIVTIHACHLADGVLLIVIAAIYAAVITLPLALIEEA